jgi:hypothetical protein
MGVADTIGVQVRCGKIRSAFPYRDPAEFVDAAVVVDGLRTAALSYEGAESSEGWMR